MGDTARDPVDHVRTNCQLTGETMKDGRIVPGLLLAAVGVFALASGVHLLAIGSVAAAALSAGIAVLLGGLGVACILAEHHRVVHQQQRWQAGHRSQ